MGYKSKAYALPRPPTHFGPHGDAWALHDKLSKQEADERAAAQATRAEQERKAAVEAANKANADKAVKLTDAEIIQHYFGIRNHFD